MNQRRLAHFAAPNIAPSSSGAPMPIGNLAGWTQFITQDFNTPATLGNFASVYPDWGRYDTFQDTSRNYGRPANQIGIYNTATTVTVHDSMFDGRVFTNASGTPQVFALTPPNQSGSGAAGGGQLYGRYSVRFKIDSTAGYKIAWLLWPQDDIWAEGEIDFPEGPLDGTIAGFAHNVTGTPSTNAYSFETGVATAGAWHTTTIEWIPGKITYTLDGQSWSTTDSSAIPTHPMEWVLQTETELTAAAPNPAVTGHVYIDWVTAYQYTPASTTTPPAPSSIPAWDHVVLVVMENRTQSAVYGNGGYMKTLADQNAYMINSFAIDHPSLPNYLALWSGSTQGVTDDNDYDFPSSTNHLGKQMAGAGKTFKAYSENLPSVGSLVSTASNNLYQRHHAPWVSWQVNGGFDGSLHVPFTQWPTDYSTLPKFTWVVPNMNDDAHDTSVSTGATWLQTYMAPYLTWAKTHNSLLIVTFDEDDESTSANLIYTVFGGAHVATGQYSQTINHFSILALLQDWLGVSRIAGSVGKAQITTPWN